MEDLEYKRRLSDIESKAISARSNLAAEYAKSNRRFQAGNIVTDHIGSIIVDKVMFSMGCSSMPDTIYCGVVLTKGMQKRKDGKIRRVSQSNLI
tara:strand:- start:238 stop:519 length:282 start_codon:yes stop_codon:yes gene_type:complete